MRGLKPAQGPFGYTPQQADHLPGFVKDSGGRFVAECSDANGPLLSLAPELLELVVEYRELGQRGRHAGLNLLERTDEVLKKARA